jgi:hypothetical protein
MFIRPNYSGTVILDHRGELKRCFNQPLTRRNPCLFHIVLLPVCQKLLWKSQQLLRPFKKRHRTQTTGLGMLKYDSSFPESFLEHRVHCSNRPSIHRCSPHFGVHLSEGDDIKQGVHPVGRNGSRMMAMAWRTFVLDPYAGTNRSQTQYC